MAYHVPHFACLLAELYAQTGDIQSGLRWCADARERAERTEELLWTAELLRIEGKLRLAEHAKTVRGENCLLKAIEVARGQGAKLFELRAATELARHLRDQEQSREALAVLKPVHDWFTRVLQREDLFGIYNAGMPSPLGTISARPWAPHPLHGSTRMPNLAPKVAKGAAGKRPQHGPGPVAAGSEDRPNAHEDGGPNNCGSRNDK